MNSPESTVRTDPDTEDGVVRTILFDLEKEIKSIPQYLTHSDRWGRVKVGSIIPVRNKLISYEITEWCHRLGMSDESMVEVLERTKSTAIVFAGKELMFVESQGIIQIYYDGERVRNPLTVRRMSR